MDAAQRAAWEEDGVFVVREALSPSALAELNTLVDAQLAEAEGWAESPVWVPRQRDSKGVLPLVAFGVPEDVNDLRWGGNASGSGLLSWGPPVLALLDCPVVLGCLREIFADRGGPRLDHDYCHVIRRSADQPSGTVRGGLHGALSSEHVTCVFELNDVAPPERGFAAVQGSHRPGFVWPFEVDEERCEEEEVVGRWRLPPYPPETAAVHALAGDCIICAPVNPPAPPFPSPLSKFDSEPLCMCAQSMRS